MVSIKEIPMKPSNKNDELPKVVKIFQSQEEPEFRIRKGEMWIPLEDSSKLDGK